MEGPIDFSFVVKSSDSKNSSYCSSHRGSRLEENESYLQEGQEIKNPLMHTSKESVAPDFEESKCKLMITNKPRTFDAEVQEGATIAKETKGLCNPDDNVAGPKNKVLNVFDEMLDAEGLGKKQVLSIMALYIVSMFCAFNVIGTTFQNAPTNFRCSLQGDLLESWNGTDSDWYDSRCPDATGVLLPSAAEEKGSWGSGASEEQDGMEMEVPRGPNGTLSCTRLDFDTSVFTSTFTSEYGLECERRYLAPLYQVTYTLGMIGGDFVSGVLADRFGRKPTLSAGTVIGASASLILYLVHDFTINLVCRFFIGFSAMTAIVSTIASLMEVVSQRYRSTLCILFGIPFGVGLMLVAAASYLIRGWRDLQVFFGSPAFAMAILIFFIDESPRWLAKRGRTDEALRILTQGVHKNRTHLSTTVKFKILERMREADSTTASKEVPFLRTMFGTPKLRVITIIVSLMWFLQGLIYVGTLLNAYNISSSPFLYVTLAGVVEIFSSFIAAWMTNKCGRVSFLITFYIGTGTMNLLVLAVPAHLAWLRVSLAMVSMLMASSAYVTSYTYVPELFPTCVRGRGTGMCACIGHISYAVAPYITRVLGFVNSLLPSFIFGLCGVLASAIMFLLPETRNMPLCETVQHVEERPLFYENVLASFKRKRKDDVMV